MQTGAKERQDIASGRFPALPTDVASHALHMCGLMTSRTKGAGPRNYGIYDCQGESMGCKDRDREA